MVGLKHTADAFFTFWAILFTTTLVRGHQSITGSLLNHQKLMINSALLPYSDALEPHSVPLKLLPKSQEPPSRVL
jgi:hypothetical protein